MEYCEEGNLNNLIELNAPYKEEIIFNFLHQIVKGYKVLYQNNIIHGCLIPANILVRKSNLKISDYGLNKLFSSLETEDTAFLYKAPEILKGQPSSSISDMWSLGVIAYQLVYKGTPWKGDSGIGLLNAIEEKELEFISDPKIKISKEFKNMLMKMLEKDPEKRIRWESLFEVILMEH